jgi:hypothetical protein
LGTFRTAWIGLLLAAFATAQGDEENTRGFKPAAVKGYFEGREIEFGNFYALLIGVNDYADNAYKDLPGTANDIDQLRSLLAGRFGFKGRVNLLRDGKARKKDILGAIQAYQPKGATPLGEKDNLLVWFAGHGRRGESEAEGYWIPQDGTTEDATWISFDQVKTELARIKAGHVLLISDSCFSGGLTTDSGAAGTDDKEVAAALKERSVQIVTSGGLEVVGDVYKHGTSPFFTQFRATLRGIGASRPYRTAWSVFDEVKTRVTRDTPQTPTRGHVEGDTGQFVFVLQQWITTPDRLKQQTEKKLFAVAEARGSLPDGRPAYAVKGSKDDGLMVLVRGSLKRRTPVWPFLIDRDEVTVGQFRRFMADQGEVKGLRYFNQRGYDGDDQPIVGVSFELARAFALWAGKRLPTEAEWEAAAGYIPEREKLRKFPWGDKRLDPRPRWHVFPVPITEETKDVCHWGARRMGTGVREWCWTVDEDPRRAVIRGGAGIWLNRRERGDPKNEFVPDEFLACSSRTETRNVKAPLRNVGFRCVKRLR